jgi:hypothetical protein
MDIREEAEDGEKGAGAGLVRCGIIGGAGSGRAPPADYEVETYDDIKKRRGPRGRWWRRIAAFSLLLSASLAVIAVM